MKGIMLRAAAFALLGIIGMGALSGEKASVWVEPFSAAYGFSNGEPRLIAGAGFPLSERFDLDCRAFGEWSGNPENKFFQLKIDALARWYAFGNRNDAAVSGGGYLAGGIGLGYGRLEGQRTYWLIAAGPIAEAGWRFAVGTLPAFAEPFVGYSLNGGPRFGEKISWNGTGGANAGLRFGIAF